MVFYFFFFKHPKKKKKSKYVVTYMNISLHIWSPRMDEGITFKHQFCRIRLKTKNQIIRLCMCEDI